MGADRKAPFSRAGPQAGRLPWVSLIVVGVLVLAAHLLLLGSVDDLLPGTAAAPAELPRSVRVSTIPAPEPAVAPAPEPPPQAVAALPPRPAPAARRRRPRPAPAVVAAPVAAEARVPDVAMAMADAASSPETASEPPAEPASAPEVAASAAEAPASAPAEPAASAALSAASAASAASASAASAPEASASAVAAASAPAAGEPIPVYPTSIPPPFTFIYDLSRSPLRGNGSLIFMLTDDGYEARLQGSVAGFSVLEWISRGGFDAAGFAPVRYTDQRLRRAPVAANFQRAAGKISYSGSTDEIPLVPGAQDRLTWMLQLASIAQARPGNLVPGARITLFVTGARADAEAWSFTVIATENVRTPVGTLETVHLLRQPRFEHDTRADVWLDPSRHYLPARARLSNSADGSDAFELALREAPSHLP